MAERSTIKALLMRFVDDELSEADVVALNEALAGDEAVQQEYVDAAYLREGMRRWAHSRGAADEWQVIRSAVGIGPPDEASSAGSDGSEWSVVAANSMPSDARYSPVDLRAARQRKNRVAIATTAAAVLILAIGGWYYRLSATGGFVAAGDAYAGDLTKSEEDLALSDSDSVVARLTAATPDVRWSGGKVPSDFLMRFRPGDILGIESGIAQVEFSGGANLVLCSPASVQFTGGTSARLMRGCVTGRADGANFVLVTPTATVVDIGTEFGVGVGPSGTDVTVFEGEIHVHSLKDSGDGGPMRRVREGMSMRIDSNGSPTVLRGQPDYPYRRDLLQPADPRGAEGTVSLLDLVGGNDYFRARIAGSIDPRTGYWGSPPWVGPDRQRALRGDTQFTATPWNPMVDGVFIPRANAREMQIDSDGHMVHLPPNNGTSWGPIWARRSSEIDRDNEFRTANRRDLWGSGTLEAVHRRLLDAKDGVLGLHANVGITFDLGSISDAQRADVVEFCALLHNLGAVSDEEGVLEQSVADLRVFVDGKLKYSRLDFNADDGEASIVVQLSPSNRFLTLVATDSDGDPKVDHVVLVDPVLRLQDKPPLACQPGTDGLCLARLLDLSLVRSR
ncbi:FecR protein [Botrimarina colliarenosi]|uniref:FecR protein n=2 Tax=Botrimarina TaxID=2795782 RepID=A0A5C5VVN4_9BACT|nr:MULTISPECIES: FecR domain-containing protein [Botrimarina]TWT42654.1 FecR protein [Botrimarina hoheduenensis]TWT92137.1 FecR protein [Botrimarina colliarenosi]